MPKIWSSFIQDSLWSRMTLSVKGIAAAPTAVVETTSLQEFCTSPLWHSDDLSNVLLPIKGERFTEVPWPYAAADDITQPSRSCVPHVLYISQRSRTDRDNFGELHQRCLHNQVALRCFTAASTPNLLWALLLVAGQRSTQQELPGPFMMGTAAAPAPQPPPPKLQSCFYGYFLPFNPDLDQSSDPDRPLPLSWLERRLGALGRRTTTEDKDIQAWRNDLCRQCVNPLTGLPVEERRVFMDGDLVLGGAGSTSSSQYWSDDFRMHFGLIEQVLPGSQFRYIMCPWARGPKGLLEPVIYHLDKRFTQECDCCPEACGKAVARRALQGLRQDGVPYKLQLAQASNGKGLGVFALEEIPDGVYIAEYTGELLDAKQANARSAQLEAAGLHYVYDLMCLDDAAAAAAAADDDDDKSVEAVAAVAANVSGQNGRKRKRRHKRLDDGDIQAVRDEGEWTAIDAAHLGNVARFFNHSCASGNIVSQLVCCGGVDEPYVSIVLRTLRKISPGEELTLDYLMGILPDIKVALRAMSGEKGDVPCSCGCGDACLGVVFPHLHVLKHLGLQNRARRVAGGRGSSGQQQPMAAFGGPSSGSLSSALLGSAPQQEVPRSSPRCPSADSTAGLSSLSPVSVSLAKSALPQATPPAAKEHTTVAVFSGRRNNSTSDDGDGCSLLSAREVPKAQLLPLSHEGSSDEGLRLQGSPSFGSSRHRTVWQGLRGIRLAGSGKRAQRQAM